MSQRIDSSLWLWPMPLSCMFAAPTWEPPIPLSLSQSANSCNKFQPYSYRSEKAQPVPDLKSFINLPRRLGPPTKTEEIA